jgi:hypothetical protein
MIVPLFIFLLILTKEKLGNTAEAIKLPQVFGDAFDYRK